MREDTYAYVPFTTWAAVLEYAREAGCVYYKAPLNHTPLRVEAKVTGQVIHLIPRRDEADPFDADARHLSRMHRLMLDPVGAKLDDLFEHTHHAIRAREEEMVAKLAEQLRTKHISEVSGPLWDEMASTYWFLQVEGLLALASYLGWRSSCGDVMSGDTPQDVLTAALQSAWFERIASRAEDRRLEEDEEDDGVLALPVPPHMPALAPGAQVGAHPIPLLVEEGARLDQSALAGEVPCLPPAA